MQTNLYNFIMEKYKAIKKDFDFLSNTEFLKFQNDERISNESKEFSFLLKLFSNISIYNDRSTKYADLKYKDLISKICDISFNDLPDEEKEIYLQEAHNRIAKKLKIPAIQVRLNNENVSQVFSFFTVDNNFENVFLDLSQKQKVYYVFNDYVKTNSLGINYLDILFHETKHLQQNYLLFNLLNGNKVTDNEKSIALLLFLDHLSLTPKFNKRLNAKNMNDEQKNRYSSYFLSAHEIDARMFAECQMKKLKEEGFFKNDTNFEPYFAKELKNELKFMSLGKDFSNEKCPLVNYTKSKINYYKIILRKFGQFGSAFKKIIISYDFTTYFNNLQNHYTTLKMDLRNYVIERSKQIKNLDKKLKFKLKSGCLETLDEDTINGLILQQEFGYLHDYFKKSAYIKKEDFYGEKLLKLKERQKNTEKAL